MLKTAARLIVVLALVMVAMSTTVAQDDGPIELTFLHIYGDARNELFVAAIDEFNAMQDDIVVVQETVEGAYEGILERLQLNAITGEFPDVALNGLTYTLFMEENFDVVPAQSFIEAEAFDTSDYFPNMLDLARGTDGELLGLPFVISTPVVFYNPALFEAAGIEEFPTTVEEIREVAAAITDAEAETFGVFYDYTVTGNWLFQAMVETFGGQMVDEDGNLAFNSDEGAAALQYWVDLVNEDASMPLGNVQQALQLFATGRLGMVITSSAGYGILQSVVPFEFGVAEFPTFDGERVIPAGGNNLYVFASTPEREAASWEFVKYLTSPEVNAPIASGIGNMTVRQSAVETPEILGDALEDDPNLQIPYNQIEDLVPWYMLPGDAGTRVYEIVQNNIEAALTGEDSVADALANAESQISEFLD